MKFIGTKMAKLTKAPRPNSLTSCLPMNLIGLSLLDCSPKNSKLPHLMHATNAPTTKETLNVYYNSPHNLSVIDT